MWNAVTLIAFFVINYHHEVYCRVRNNVTIVGLFHPEEMEEKAAFRIAVERVNLLMLRHATITPRIEEVSQYDSFNASIQVCNILAEDDSNVVAIFGPQSDSIVGIVKSIADRYEIPHIETRWDTTSRINKMSINLYPESQILAQAIMAAIKDMDWKSFTIIYEDNIGLLRLQGVLKGHYSHTKGKGQAPFTLHQLGEGPDYRPLLKGIKSSGENHIVLDCKADKILEILRQARSVEMMGDYNSYIITSLDAHTIDFQEFKYGPTNITALRMLDPSSYILQKAIQDWIFEENRNNRTTAISSDTVKTHSALTYDAVHLFAEAWIKLGTQFTPMKPIDCFSEKGIEKDLVDKSIGFRLINFMKLMQEEGMTGHMAFDSNGFRNYFTLEILQLVRKGFKKLGSWDPKHGINYTRTKSEMEGERLENIRNKTFIVVSKIGRPYLDYKKGEGLKGNDRFEGYSLDLIDAIAKDLGFSYEFRIVKDYGKLDKTTGKWNGIIKELIEQRGDLGICDLTITYDRRSAVDFTMPFMTLGISILFTKPVQQPPELFFFFKPLSVEVWVYMATAYLGISLILYILSRISPYERNAPENKFELHANQLTMVNLIWLNCGALMQQGSDIVPQAFSTRMVAAMWWFFTLIMSQSYIANLTAFLTSERLDSPIAGVEDLAEQNKIKYGVMYGGSTYNFFRDSNESLYQKMWNQMESAQPSVFVDDNDDGVERVQNGKRQYAYFMESTSIEYQMERKCDLAMIGGLLDSKGYGIALPMDSQYRTLISGSVLKLQEHGNLQNLKHKWWKKMHGGGACDDQNEASPSSIELKLSKVGGVFLVLIIGCGISFLVACIEFIWNVRKVAIQEKISPKEAFFLELKFALRCHGTTKEIRRAREPSTKGSFMRLDVLENNK